MVLARLSGVGARNALLLCGRHHERAFLHDGIRGAVSRAYARREDLRLAYVPRGGVERAVCHPTLALATISTSHLTNRCS